MRLDALKSGGSLLQKALFLLIRKKMGFLPGPVAMMSYKKKFFGKDFAHLVHAGLRDAQHWELVDLEIMGAFVSHRNSCQLCLLNHTAVVSQIIEPTIMQAVIDDHHTAPISSKLKVSLDLLEKLAQSPETLLAEDFLPLKAEGLSDDAIEEAMLVALIFCSINRISDTLGFDEAPDQEKVGEFLFSRGYKSGSLPG